MPDTGAPGQGSCVIDRTGWNGRLERSGKSCELRSGEVKGKLKVSCVAKDVKVTLLMVGS